MKVKAVKQYSSPKYPTIDKYSSHPELFLNHAPKSWIDNAKIWTALVAFSLSTSQCNGQDKSKNSTEITDKKGDPQKKEKEIPKSFVSPIFVHGEGTGATGCIVMNPPVFITEKEAKQVIINEFKKNNIEIDTTTNKQITLSKKQFDFDTRKAKTVEVKHQFDGYNPKLNFVFDFISSDDYYELKDNEGILSTVSSFNYRKIANELRNKIIDNKKINAVIFYDPVVHAKEINLDDKATEKEWKKAYEEQEKSATEEAKNQLIKQVDDFISWLKKENYL